MGPDFVCRAIKDCVLYACHFSHDSMVCLSGTRVESRIVSPVHPKTVTGGGSKVSKQSPVASLTQRRATPFDVSSNLLYFLHPQLERKLELSN